METINSLTPHFNQPDYFKTRGIIFKSKFSLAYMDGSMEQIYNADMVRRNRKNIFFSIFILIFQLTILMLNIFKNDEISKASSTSSITNDVLHNQISKNFFLIYSSLLISIFNLIFNVATIKNKLRLININHVTFLSMNIVLISFRNYIFIITSGGSSSSNNTNILIIFEIFTNAVYLLVIKINYISVCISCLISIFVLWMSASFNSGIPYYQSVTLTGVYILVGLFNYVNCFYSKLLFYAQLKSDLNNKNYHDTLDNLNNGYAIFNDKKLIYRNKYFNVNLSFLMEKRNYFTTIVDDANNLANNLRNNLNNENNFNKKQSVNTNLFVDGNTKINNTGSVSQQMMERRSLFHHTNKFIKEEELGNNNESQPNFDKYLLTDLSTLNPELPTTIQNILMLKNITLNEVLDIFHKQSQLDYLDSCQTKNKTISTEKENKKENIFLHEFTFLGTKKFEDLGKPYYLEISLRLVKNNLNPESPNFEFLFNDITGSKLIELSKEIVKNKTMLLAKASHEFKNPVIIISELVEEISEDIKNNKFDSMDDNLSLLTNLSSYMLVLVKDFEVISKKEASSSITLTNAWFDLRKEMVNLKGIVLTLISRKCGDSLPPLTFNIHVEESVPSEIYTDKMRLLQVLINLLSNSIKFTQNGLITLAIYTVDSKVWFSVEDTGVGLSEHESKNLFKEYAVKSDDIANSNGSGLGLSIVKELCSSMGSQISFQHNHPQGSIFTFSVDHVDLRPRRLVQSSKNVITNANSSLFLSTRVIETPSTFIQNVIIPHPGFPQNIPSTPKKMLNNIKKAQTYSKENIITVNLRNPKPHFIMNNKYSNNNLNFSGIDENAELKYSSGDIEQLQRLELTHLNTFKNGSYVEKSTTKTYTIDSAQAMKNLPCAEIIGNSPSRSDSSFTMVHKYKRNSLVSNCLNLSESNSKSLNKIKFFKITSFDFECISEEKDIFSHSRLIIKNIKNKNHMGRKIYNSQILLDISDINIITPQNKIISNKLKTTDIFNTNIIANTNYLKTTSHNLVKISILIIDDDKMIRKSIVRTIEKYFQSSNLTFEVTLIEAPDGIEGLMAVYNSVLNNCNVDLVMTDESMNFMSGSHFLDAVSKIFGSKIPVAILTSYESGTESLGHISNGMINGISLGMSQSLSKNSIDNASIGIFTKPLGITDFEKILSKANILK